MAIKYIANAITYDKLHTSILQVTTRFIATTYTLSIYSHAIKIIAIFHCLKKIFFQKKKFSTQKSEHPKKSSSQVHLSRNRIDKRQDWRKTLCV